MKKTTFLIYALFLLAMANTVFAQTTNENPSAKSRRVYCVSMHNPDWNNRHGITVFNTGDPSTSMQLLFQYDADFSIYAGAAANDTYYAYFYRYGGRGPEPVGIRSVNLRTGEDKIVVDWIGKLAGDWPKFQDMTYDYVSNTMYAVAFLAGDSYLATVDLTNGELKKVVSFERVVATIAASNEGVLYAIDMEGTLCTVNKENGKLTKLIETTYAPSLSQSMEFDRTDGTLYWATAQYGVAASYLIKFDLANKTYSNLGILGGEGTQVVGMYIPFLRTGFDVPGTATDIAVKPADKGEEKAIINWKNPINTFGNDPLLEITSLTVSRDGEVIQTYEKVEDLVLGKEMSFEDNTVKSGMHLYSICATNSAGVGDEGKIDCFVGFDKPAAVGNLKANPTAACKSATLTWEAPTEGQYKGFFDNSDLSYTVVRLPDSVTVAKDLKALTYTDETSTRLTGYIYEVIANNAAGASKAAQSEKVVIGKALAMPYTFDFVDDNEFKNTWMVYDSNGDGTTWQVRSPMGKPYFGDKQLMPAAEYMMQDESIELNEWLITPPITFVKGIKKVLTFGARNVGMDQLIVTMGNNNTIESQTIELNTFNIKSKKLESSEDNVPFETMKVEFGDMNGTYCIGFHLVTPAGNSIIFQIGDVYVGEPNSITEEMISDVKVFSMNNTLQVTGEFTQFQVYNASGICMKQANAEQSEISTSNWPSGVYYVKVMNGNSAKVLKTVIR